MEWKDIVELKKENALLRMKLNVVNAENESLKEELAKKEHDYRLLGEYYECAIQREDELADLMWEKEEEIELCSQQIDMYIEKEQKYQDKLAEATQMLTDKDEEIKSNKDFIKELGKTNEITLDKLVEASEKIQELQVERDLANLRMCQAEGKLEKAENYLRMFTGRENW